MDNKVEIVKSDNKISAFELKPIDIGTIQKQMEFISKLKQSVMTPDVDYGAIPGCGEKPTLLKSGAEKLLMLFRLRPIARLSVIQLEGEHREYRADVDILDSKGEVIATGIGVCSTLENKYRYRNAKRKCPSCGESAIQAGKKEYGGGYFCNKKSGGCGTKFSDKDPTLNSQHEGKIQNQDIPDTYNTVAKMAKKRGLVDATLTACAASGMFTQDVEDFASWDDMESVKTKNKTIDTEDDTGIEAPPTVQILGVNMPKSLAENNPTMNGMIGTGSDLSKVSSQKLDAMSGFFEVRAKDSSEEERIIFEDILSVIREEIMNRKSAA